MKKSCLFLGISFVAALFAFSCRNAGVEVPEVLKNDTIIETYNFAVSDTFDNGAVRRVRFFEKEDSGNIAYEKRFYKSGNICMEGPLDADSLRDGRWKAWYETGELWSVGDYKHGLRHGENKVYYPNGQVEFNKNYVNDTAEGIWTFYQEDGREIFKVIYEKGVVIEQIGAESVDSL